MYTNEKYSTKIYISCGNGIYLFSNESATGKTRLFKVLRKIQGYDKNVKTYTYDDLLIENKTLDAFLENIGEGICVIFIDRFDMLEVSKKNIEQLKKLGKDHIILIDCKQIELLAECDFKDAGITMTEQTITVED